MCQRLVEYVRDPHRDLLALFTDPWLHVGKGSQYHRAQDSRQRRFSCCAPTSQIVHRGFPNSGLSSRVTVQPCQATAERATSTKLPLPGLRPTCWTRLAPGLHRAVQHHLHPGALQEVLRAQHPGGEARADENRQLQKTSHHSNRRKQPR